MKERERRQEEREVAALSAMGEEEARGKIMNLQKIKRERRKRVKGQRQEGRESCRWQLERNERIGGQRGRGRERKRGKERRRGRRRGKEEKGEQRREIEETKREERREKGRGGKKRKKKRRKERGEERGERRGRRKTRIMRVRSTKMRIKVRERQGHRDKVLRRFSS